MTLNGKKIDFRFCVALRNVRPLELYMMNEYFVRGAKEPFSMDEGSFQNMNIHLTTEFIISKDFEKSDANNNDWLKNAKKAILDVFIAFEARHGDEITKLGNKNQSRALYGVDVSIDSNNNAFVLELTNNPVFENYNQFPQAAIQ